MISKEDNNNGLNIDKIKRGVVLDHIAAGRSMEIYKYLKLSKLDCSVAIIKNVKSRKMGKKDIIKIEDEIDINMDALGYIDPNITMIIVEDGEIKTKQKLSLPRTLSNVIICKNPRCITSTEQGLEHVFELAEGGAACGAAPKNGRVYRCRYCEQENK